MLMAFLVTQMLKNLPAMQETQVQSTGREDTLEKGMATQSTLLAWRIPWTEKPGRYNLWGHKALGTTELLTLSHVRGNRKIWSWQEASKFSIFFINNFAVCVCVCSVAQSCPTLCGPWTVAHQAPLSLRFSRQEYWSWVPFPTPGHLSNPWIESVSLASPTLAGEFFSTD